MGAIFEISALENPRVPNFIEIGQDLVFGHFWGDSTPKNISFLEKNRTQIFIVRFVLSIFGKQLHKKFQQNRLIWEKYMGKNT